MAVALQVIGIENWKRHTFPRFAYRFFSSHIVLRNSTAINASSLAIQSHSNECISWVVMATQFDIKCDRKRDEKVKRAEKLNLSSTITSKRGREKNAQARFSWPQIICLNNPVSRQLSLPPPAHWQYRKALVRSIGARKGPPNRVIKRSAINIQFMHSNSRPSIWGI